MSYPLPEQGHHILAIRDIQYHIQIDGSGEPLVLLHGFTGSSQNWNQLITDLADKFLLIRIDLLGHGQSTAPADPNRYQMTEAALDLNLILSALNLSAVHLLGYSMGGRLALYFSLTYPESVKKLILESASPGLTTVKERQQRKANDDKLADRIEREGIESFVDFWEAIPLFSTQQRLPLTVRERLRQQRLQNNSQGLANSLRGMGTGVQPSLWRRLGELIIPTLLLVGALDKKFVEINEQMESQFPTAQLLVVERAGHTVHLEDVGVYGERVSRWLLSEA